MAPFDEQRHFARGGADRDATLLNNGLGHGVEGDRLRERRRQAMEAAGACGERPATGLAGAQGELHFLAFRDLLIRARALRLRFGPGAQRVLVLPGAIERLRGAGGQGLEVFAIVLGKRLWSIEAELRQRDHTTSDEEWDHRERPATCLARLDRQVDEDRNTPADRVGGRTFLLE